MYMSLFTKEDFTNPITWEMLRAIATVKCGHSIMTPFNSFAIKQKRVVNEYLNNYIKNSLAGEDWELVLQSDFNDLCQEEIFDDSFGEKRDYTNIFVKNHNPEPVLITGDLPESAFL